MLNSSTRPQWEEKDSQDFIKYGKYFVPDREAQIDCICELIPRPSKPAHIFDLCCGQGLLTRALLSRFPECQVHGLDGSLKMIDQVEKELSVYRGRFHTRQIDLAARDWREFPFPVHAVVSSLAIHHLDNTEKHLLFKDMLSLLTPGGSFIIADLIEPVTQLGKRHAAKTWDETVRQRSLDLDGTLSAYNYFREIEWNLFTYPDPIDKPSTLLNQLNWLNEVGFIGVDVFWLKAGHAIFGGRKPHA